MTGRSSISKGISVSLTSGWSPMACTSSRYSVISRTPTGISRFHLAFNWASKRRPASGHGQARAAGGAPVFFLLIDAGAVDLSVPAPGRLSNTMDRLSFFRRGGIAGRRQDHGQGGLRIPFDLHAGQFPFGDRL